MITKYCIVRRDADVVLRYFNVNTDDYDSFFEYEIAVQDIFRTICSEVGVSFVDVEVYEKFDFCSLADGADYAEIICYDEV